MARPDNKSPRGRREPKEFEEEVIQVDRVTRVVKGGRRLRFRATVAVGDKKGRIGYGIGKSTEVQGAIQKAVSKAKKLMIKIPIYKGTIPHTIQVKYKAAIVLLKPASEGTGIIAGGAVRKVLELAGVKNVLSKSLGSNNRLNTTKAAYQALSKLRIRPELETDEVKVVKAEEAQESKSAPQVKTMSAKEAREKSDAGKRGTNANAAKKTPNKSKA